ncbi:MAG TPA: pyridoxamine 5'-phosphate oxidase family protein [Gemmatimonadaceae bacterium]|nr:pyridoxamine 5'-phosphate oxidase family protein [Gemmatimonadaceae bacterium]
MTTQELYDFIRQHTLGVMATVSPTGTPEAALVGIAVTPELELILDTAATSRKCTNVRDNPRVAFVIGRRGEVTLQYEGMADEPRGSELRRCKAVYFDKFPEGREREQWPDITYIRVRPTWLRYSDYSQTPAQIAERSFTPDHSRAAPIRPEA